MERGRVCEKGGFGKERTALSFRWGIHDADGGMVIKFWGFRME